MLKRLFSFSFFILVCVSGISAQRIELLNGLRAYLRENLQLDVGNTFYTEWSLKSELTSYVYVSSPDSIAGPAGLGDFIFIGEDSLKGDSVARSYRDQGFATLHYRTAGTSGAMLNTPLWSYPDEAFVFIVIHEAVHVHLQRKSSKLEYEKVESLCDAIANYYGPVFLRIWDHKYSAFINQKRIMERIYHRLNEAEERFYKYPGDRKQLFQRIESKIHSYLLHSNPFLIQRYGYAVNTAYLLRNHSYYKHYFGYRARLRAGEGIRSVLGE